MSQEDRQLLSERKKLLVIDDVLVSGSRIYAFNEALREAAAPPESVDFLVGIARPPSALDWKRHVAAVSRVPWHSSLTCVETLFLPDWDSRHCPWCREYDFLAGVSRSMPDPPNWLSDRVAALGARERGVDKEPLLLLSGVATRRLGNGSYAGPEGMSSIATLFSVAAALQRLRNDKEDRRLDPHFPAFRVFSVRNLRNYSEGLLRAVILRALLPSEWGLTTQPVVLAKDLKAYAEPDTQDVIRGEILLAVARGTVDHSLLVGLKEVFSQHLGDAYGDIFAFLRG